MDRVGKTGAAGEAGCVCGCITLIAGRGPLPRTQRAGEKVERWMLCLRDEDGRDPTGTGAGGAKREAE